MSDPAPFTLIRPASVTAPVVLTSPHSGRHYAPRFLAASRLDAIAIRRSEDSFVDELFAAGPALGVPLLAAQFPRAWCDVNREAWELDPAMFSDALPDYVNTESPRVTAGLGTIARIVGSGETIYDAKLPFAEARARIAACWEPYHAALRGMMGETMARFGVCLVIDCHSMPSTAARAGLRPDIVLGDSHGTSCAPAVTAFLRREMERLGLQTRCNDPYAGGYITRQYGRPREGMHAIQVEVARALYMSERDFTRHAGFETTRQQLGQFLAAVISGAERLLPRRNATVQEAAE